jgi:6-phosphogluconolactonase
MHGETEIYPDLDILSHAAAQAFVNLANRYIQQQGRFNVALAGGSTPKHLYEYLASKEFAGQLDWSRVFFYFGDERHVAHDHPDSNYLMVRAALLDHIPVPPFNIHPFDTQLEVRKSAASYARLLVNTLPRHEGLPRFDLVLLGMGPDGHTASLFPATCILHDERLAAAVYVEKLHAWRLSLTYAVINNADHVWLLVAGENKAPVLAQLDGPEAGRYPVDGVRPRGELKWYLDKSVASSLETAG